MKTPKLIQQVRDLMNADSLKKKKRISNLKQILGKLKARSKALRAKIKHEKNGGDRKALQKELNMVNAQRKKGLKAVKSLTK